MCFRARFLCEISATVCYVNKENSTHIWNESGVLKWSWLSVQMNWKRSTVRTNSTTHTHTHVWDGIVWTLRMCVDTWAVGYVYVIHKVIWKLNQLTLNIQTALRTDTHITATSRYEKRQINTRHVQINADNFCEFI